MPIEVSRARRAPAVATALTSAVSWEDETVAQLAKAGAIVFEPRRGRFKIGNVQETIIVVDVGRCASRSWVVDCVYRSDPSFERRGLAATSRYPEGFATWFGDFDDVIINVQQQIAEGDRLAIQLFLRAMHRGKRRKVSLATIRIDRFTQDKIAASPIARHC